VSISLYIFEDYGFQLYVLGGIVLVKQNMRDTSDAHPLHHAPCSHASVFTALLPLHVMRYPPS